MLVDSILVALGGMTGTLARFWLSEASIRWFGAAFPWGTVIVNITGCFVIGFFTIITGPEGRFPVPQPMRLLIMIGVCGGYTTFSSFSLQTVSMLTKGDYGSAAMNVVGSVFLCLLATFVGIKMATLLNT